MATEQKKYNIIYADPPWHYDNKLSNDPRWGGITYPTMPTEEIMALPIQEMAADNAVLFLWTTMPKIQEGLDVVTAWGFAYRTVAFVWVKMNPATGVGVYSGIGKWTNSNAEIVLLGKRGTIGRDKTDVKQIAMYARREHSAKPPEIRERIVRLMGDLPRIELFARQPKPGLFGDTMVGWDVWGNEVESDIELEGCDE